VLANNWKNLKIKSFHSMEITYKRTAPKKKRKELDVFELACLQGGAGFRPENRLGSTKFTKTWQEETCILLREKALES
jgi:hypothetical protein